MRILVTLHRTFTVVVALYICNSNYPTLVFSIRSAMENGHERAQARLLTPCWYTRT